MKLSSLNSMLMTRSLALTGILIFMGINATQAQTIGTPEQTGSTLNQPLPTLGQPLPKSNARPTPGQGGSLVGQPPPPAQSGAKPIQPNYPAAGSTGRSDPVKSNLNRANREAADNDRDGKINPAEASRMPPGTPMPR